MAASVPRHLRQSRLGYLPMSCIVGSRYLAGDRGANLVHDIIMLPAEQFQRMRTYVALQHVVAPALNMGPDLQSIFVIHDARQVAVPDSEMDADAFARAYFFKVFGLATPEKVTDVVEDAAMPLSAESESMDDELGKIESSFTKMLKNRK